MAERFDEGVVDVEALAARLEAKIESAIAASDAKLTSLETRISSGFSRLECRLDRLFELQRRRRSASD